MTFTLPTLTDLRSPALTLALQHKIDHKTKPLGSLGRLEQLALQLGEILGTGSPALTDPQLVVFAGDHGLAARGVSAFPSDVSWQMVENFLAGGAAVSVFSRLNHIALTVVDCGVNHDFLAGLPAGTQRPGLQVRKVPGGEHGTLDSSAQAAMTALQCQQAMQNGMDLVKALPGNALLLGEMGIGNTSAASLLLSRLAGLEVDVCTGAGTGLDAPAVQRKTAILREVLARHPDAKTPLDALAAFATIELRMRNIANFGTERFPVHVLRERQDTKARYEVSAEGLRISAIFAAVEAQKDELRLADYGVSQTSLEQVFNMHAAEAEKLKQGRDDH